MKLLTIIIPAYNVENYIKDALIPYLSLENTIDLEVLIINDGSKDNTLSLVQEYEQKYSEFVKVIDKKNGGHGSAINTGVKYATGRYFKVVDGDDWLDTQALERLLEYLKKIDVDMVATGFEIVCEDIGQKEEIHIRNIEYGKVYEFESICSSIDYVRMHSTIFKTELWKLNKIILDEHCFYVDVEHDLFPLKWLKTVVFYDLLLYQYRIGRQGQSVSMNSMVKNRNDHMKVIKKIMSLSKDETLSQSIREYIERKLENMVGFQYAILFASKIGKENKMELIEYDNWLKNNSVKIYNKIRQKKILLLRKTRFEGYYIIKFIHHYFGKKEKYVK